MKCQNAGSKVLELIIQLEIYMLIKCCSQFLAVFLLSAIYFILYLYSSSRKQRRQLCMKWIMMTNHVLATRGVQQEVNVLMI